MAELIEEESAARKLRKKMKREEEERNINSEKSKENKEETEAPQPIDSLTSQPSDSPTDVDASIQETNLNNSQAVVESQRIKEGESTKAKDGGLQMGDTGQMTEYCLKEEEVRRRRGAEEEE